MEPRETRETERNGCLERLTSPTIQLVWLRSFRLSSCLFLSISLLLIITITDPTDVPLFLSGQLSHKDYPLPPTVTHLFFYSPILSPLSLWPTLISRSSHPNSSLSELFPRLSTHIPCVADTPLPKRCRVSFVLSYDIPPRFSYQNSFEDIPLQ